jgi:biopolymer transport protein ExbD
MSYLRKLGSAEVSTSSMADIAFLLLTFFLMTTVIKNEKGLMIMLPGWSPEKQTSEVNKRNLFTIHINSQNSFLVEGIPRKDLSGIRDEIKKFILNNGVDRFSSESPSQAIVSIKTDRTTTHKAFIEALDKVQGAYYEIYASRVNVSIKRFRELDLSKMKEKQIYDKARSGIPMNISVAEPSQVNPI